MTLRDQSRRIAAGASVALATSGLSNCTDNGAVDPPPPPLECNTLNMGQSLSAMATRSADTVEVTIRNTLSYAAWQIDRVTAVTGATLVSTRLPDPAADHTLGLVFRLESDTTTEASFTVEATLSGGYPGDACNVQRTFVMTISPAGVQISRADRDPLPLAARQSARILLAQQEGRVVELHAETAYQGERRFAWTVTAGELDSQSGPAVRWTLPALPGIYQAELVIDFGSDGLALDMLLLEVIV